MPHNFKLYRYPTVTPTTMIMIKILSCADQITSSSGGQHLWRLAAGDRWHGGGGGASAKSDWWQ